jgi:hypothetical protein
VEEPLALRHAALEALVKDLFSSAAERHLDAFGIVQPLRSSTPWRAEERPRGVGLCPSLRAKLGREVMGNQRGAAYLAGEQRGVVEKGASRALEGGIRIGGPRRGVYAPRWRSRRGFTGIDLGDTELRHWPWPDRQRRLESWSGLPASCVRDGSFQDLGQGRLDAASQAGWQWGVGAGS